MAPRSPTTGSSHSQPKARAANSPTITKHGHDHVGGDMDERGAQIVVAAIVRVPVVVVMFVVVIMVVIMMIVVVVMIVIVVAVVMVVAQQVRAHDIDDEAEEGDRDRLVERDRRPD